jgi:dihydrofolate reductase
MRKLKLQMNGTDLKWDDEVVNFCLQNLENVDCIALGRNTAEDFIPYWTNVKSSPTDPEYKLEKPLGKPLADIHKVVFSKKLEASKWENATILNGDIVEDINTLKKKKGNDIIAYGGYSFVSSLIQHGLIDEFYFLINPIIIVSGEPLFKALKSNLQLTFEKCEPFKCGTILLCYKKN